MNDTDIEWAHKTINPCVGCNHGCPWCYARKQAKRNACMSAAIELKAEGVEYKHLPPEERMALYKTTDAWCQDCYDFKPHPHLERLDQITMFQQPKRIFIDSMWDWNCKANKDEWLNLIISKMMQCSQHTFIILSKRPEGYADWNFPKNVWLGISITCQEDIYRIEELMATDNDNLKFLSIEPLRGFIDYPFEKKEIGWIICGAETGNTKGKVTPKGLWLQNIIFNAGEIPVFLKNSLEDYWSCPELCQEFPEV